jgi:hypothetical protein
MPQKPMKPIFSMSKFYIFLVLLAFIQQIASAQNPIFRGKTWYVSAIVSGDPQAPTQEFKIGEQLFKVSEDDLYTVRDFLGVSQQEGRLIESENVIVMSDQDKGYFAVFRLLSQTDTAVSVRYVPFVPSTHSLEIVFKPMPEVIQPIVNEAVVEDLNFEGRWVFEQAGMKLDLEIMQSGKAIKGKHCGGSSQANCEGSYLLVGEIEGKVAKFNVLEPFTHSVMAKAVIGKIDHPIEGKEAISWSLIENTQSIKTVDGVMLKKK